jgi:protein-S-isoprenylcysteine O-methyltransferase Ste14
MVADKSKWIIVLPMHYEIVMLLLWFCVLNLQKLGVPFSQMTFDWQNWRDQHPNLFKLIVVGKKLRTKIGFVLAVSILVESVWSHEVPLDPDRLSIKVGVALLLILVGLLFRIFSYGFLHKQEVLATTGIYSLCRHPLYFGSILATLGFCILINDPKSYVLAAIYFGGFYTLTIIWEEIRLDQRFGEAHRLYVLSTPALLPLGRFQPCSWSFRKALRKGGISLIVSTLLLLGLLSVMAETM